MPRISWSEWCDDKGRLEEGAPPAQIALSEAQWKELKEQAVALRTTVKRAGEAVTRCADALEAIQKALEQRELQCQEEQ